jgi:hypothetical protein
MPSLPCTAHHFSYMFDYQLMHIFHKYTLDDTIRVCFSVSVCVLCVCTLSLFHSLVRTLKE